MYISYVAKNHIKCVSSSFYLTELNDCSILTCQSLAGRNHCLALLITGSHLHSHICSYALLLGRTHVHLHSHTYSGKRTNTIAQTHTWSHLYANMRALTHTLILTHTTVHTYNFTRTRRQLL